jgi:hypothetical protein
LNWKTGIKKYTLNPDGSIDVSGDVDLYNRGLSKLSLKFGMVSGNFYCQDNQLTSLEGAPEEVGVNFYWYYNQLTSLLGAPRKLGGGFYCINNPLPQLILDNLGIIQEIIKKIIQSGEWMEP